MTKYQQWEIYCRLDFYQRTLARGHSRRLRRDFGQLYRHADRREQRQQELHLLHLLVQLGRRQMVGRISSQGRTKSAGMWSH